MLSHSVAVSLERVYSPEITIPSGITLLGTLTAEFTGLNTLQNTVLISPHFLLLIQQFIDDTIGR